LVLSRGYCDCGSKTHCKAKNNGGDPPSNEKDDITRRMELLELEKEARRLGGHEPQRIPQGNKAGAIGGDVRTIDYNEIDLMEEVGK